MNLFRLPERLARRHDGVASLEFAIILPMLLVLMLAGTDATLWLRTRLRTETIAAEVANIVGQYRQLNCTANDNDFTNIFAAAQDIAGATPVTGLGGATILSLVLNDAGTPHVAWQQRTGNPIYLSQFHVGATPTLPGGYLTPFGQSLIIAEVFTGSGGWVFSSSLLGVHAGTVAAISMQQPRLALLSTTNPNPCPP